MPKISTRAQLETRLGVKITRAHILDGAGPARFGWGALHPCKTSWLGRTLADVADRLIATDVDNLWPHASEHTLTELGWSAHQIDHAVSSGSVARTRDGRLVTR